MGLSPLGPRWRRRIARVTGLDVVHASGGGTYVFSFTTADHRHGWFDLKAYRNGGQCWGMIPHCPLFSSCRSLFPATPSDAREDR